MPNARVTSGRFVQNSSPRLADSRRARARRPIALPEPLKRSVKYHRVEGPWWLDECPGFPARVCGSTGCFWLIVSPARLLFTAYIGYVGKTFFCSSRPSTVPKWTVIVSDRVRFAAVPLCPLGKFFLQRDAMLARYMLSSSVRHKPVVYRNDWTIRTAWFGHGGFFHLAYSVLYGNSGSSKQQKRVPSCGTLSQTLDLENFATASRPRRQ